MLTEFYLSNGEVKNVGLVKRKRVQSFNTEPSMTKQEFVAECDINNIIKHFVKSGQLPLSSRMPHYGDYSDVPTFQESLQIVINAQNQFDSLDADLRKRFSNDPAEFLAFMANPENADEAVRLGLAHKPEPQAEPAPQKVILVTPPDEDTPSPKKSK